MIGVIVVPGRAPGMLGLEAKRSPALLPLGDRSVLQHIVESLVAQKITTIELIIDHAPERIEALLGNGDRWGAKFRYHLVAQSERPYRSLRVISGLKSEPWLLIHAERYPEITLPPQPNKPIVYFEASGDNASQHSMGAAVFPAGFSAEVLANLTLFELREQFEAMAIRGEAEIVNVPEWIKVYSPEALLHSQTLLLERHLGGRIISGTEREPGIWISRNVAVHPSVILVAPVYIGPDTRINRGVRIGPNVVIEGESIIDSNTSIENSMVTAGSYIGEGLELDSAIVDQSLLINVRLGTGVNIPESFLLGGLKIRPRQPWFVRISQSVAAIALFVIFLPILLIALLAYAIQGKFLVSISVLRIPARPEQLLDQSYSLLCIGKDAWSTPRKAGWSTFLRQFLPGLLAVAQGKLSFVGFPPRNSEEVQAFSEEWRQLYLNGAAGLITEAALAESDPRDDTQRYLADAYYSVRRGLIYNLKLATRYFVRLFIPGI